VRPLHFNAHHEPPHYIPPLTTFTSLTAELPCTGTSSYRPSRDHQTSSIVISRLTLPTRTPVCRIAAQPIIAPMYSLSLNPSHAPHPTSPRLLRCCVPVAATSADSSTPLIRCDYRQSAAICRNSRAIC